MLDLPAFVILAITRAVIVRYWRQIIEAVREFKKCLKAVDDFLTGPPR